MTYGLSVIEFHQAWLGPGLSVVMLVTASYVTGRVHQFFKQTDEREQAYRDGYNTATKTLFALATRVAKGSPPMTAPVETPMMRGYASVPEQHRSPLPARHRAAGRRKTTLKDTERLVLPENQAA
jgi:hypothetical protein